MQTRVHSFVTSFASTSLLFLNSCGEEGAVCYRLWNDKATVISKQRALNLGRRYNVCMKKGSKMSEESREKMRKFRLGNPGYWLGKKRSDAYKLKFSLSHIGKKRSELSRKKQGETIQQRNKLLYPNYVPSTQVLLNRKRKERMRKQLGYHTQGEWWVLKAQYNWTCPSCKREEPNIKLTRDHIIPVSRGGSDNIENIQPLCRSCNSKKYIKTTVF